MYSIITSLYRSDRYLENLQKALRYFAENLQRQNISFEVIIVANEPSEREQEFCKRFSSNAWFSFQQVARESLYASWNRGVALAKGNYVGFWNADDIRYPEALAKAEEFLAKGKDLVYFPFYIARYLKILSWYMPLPKQLIDSQVPEFSQANTTEFERSMHCGPFFIFTKSLYQRAGPFDEQFKIAGDFEWCVRAVKAGGHLVKAPTPGGEFRLDRSGLSAGANERLVAENNLIYIRHNVWDKIRHADDLLMKEYSVRRLLFGGSFRPLPEIPSVAKMN